MPRGEAPTLDTSFAPGSSQDMYGNFVSEKNSDLVSAPGF